MPKTPGPDVGALFPVLSPAWQSRLGSKWRQLAPSGSSHEQGCYYVNAVTGSIQRECNPINAALLAGAGYMGRGWIPATPFNAFGSFEEAKSFAEREHNLIIGNPDPGQIITGPKLPSQNPPSGGGGSGASSGDDWSHLMTRLAEFGIGAILVIIGLNAIVSKTKGYQKVETVVMGAARRVPPV